tara:strand:+ start:3324 stop:4250 length:927 start_codon:yes stop_codon:yes gene_type:complete
MTIASTNTKFSDIASELGIGNSNLSLKDLSDEQMKMHIASSGTGASSEYGTFTLTMLHAGNNSARNGSTVTSAQGQGVNGLNAAPYGMSEWHGFDPGDATYKPANSTASIWMGTHTSHPNALTTKSVVNTGCFVDSGCTNNIYCTKSGSTITIYVQETTETQGFIAYGGDTHVYSHTTATAIGGSHAIGTITAGTGQSVPTACSMNYSTLTSTASGGFFSSGLNVATVPGGSTGTTNLGATKIGYKIRSGGRSEGGPGTSGYAIAHVLVHFDFYGVSGVTNSASAPMRVSVGLRQSSYADHGSGFQSC